MMPSIFSTATRTRPEHALATLEAAAEGGASCLVLCDTNGGTLPSEVMQICHGRQSPPARHPVRHPHPQRLRTGRRQRPRRRQRRRHARSKAPSTATANAPATATSPPSSPSSSSRWAIPVVPHLEKLRDLSYFVDDVSNNPHFARAPFVGRTAFAHKGGMHVNAVQKLARSYEHIEPGQRRQRTEHPRLRTQRPGQHPDQGRGTRPAARQRLARGRRRPAAASRNSKTTATRSRPPTARSNC